MNITVNFSSIEELREFQRTVRIAGTDEKPDDRAVPRLNEADVQVPEAAPVPAVTEAPEAAIREPEAVPQSVPVAAPALYSLDDLARAGMSLMDQGRQADLQQLLHQFGVSALPQIPKEQYGAFATALREMGAPI